MPRAETPSPSGTSLWRHGDFRRYLTGQAASVAGSRAVMDGHGRPFTPEEENQLTVLSVLDAVSGISYGTAHGDPNFLGIGAVRIRETTTGQADLH